MQESSGGAQGSRRKTSARGQSFEQRSSAWRRTGVDRHEVRFRIEGAQSETGRDLGVVSTTGVDFLDDRAEVIVILESGQGSGLADAIHAEVEADLLEGLENTRMSEGIADPGAGQAVGLRECPQSNYPRVVDFDRDDIVGVAMLEVGLIQDEETILRQRGDESRDGDGRKLTAGRVVRIREVDQARALLACRVGHRLDVHSFIAVGNRHDPGPESPQVEGKHGISPFGADPGVRGVDEAADEHGEKFVRAGRDHDLVKLQTVALRQAVAKIMIVGVTVIGALARGPHHRFDRAR